MVVAAVTLEVRRGTMNGATIAILGMLSASAGLLRLLDLPGGGSGLFFLVVLAGAAFGPRFGLLLGLCSMAVSAVITGGSARWGQVGYWVDQRHAGAGVIPTAVALVVDHCLLELDLHRIEVAIRPENTASLRVVEKLGFTEIGYAPRYLHIDGDWRDHRLFAITAEEVGEGLLRRWKARQGPESHQPQ